jgi:hypothetical protein
VTGDREEKTMTTTDDDRLAAIEAKQDAISAKLDAIGEQLAALPRLLGREPGQRHLRLVENLDSGEP